jgi:hypothetical protein
LAKYIRDLSVAADSRKIRVQFTMMVWINSPIPAKK